MDCNDGNVKDFVGYKYPTYACYGLLRLRYSPFFLLIGGGGGGATLLAGGVF